MVSMYVFKKLFSTNNVTEFTISIFILLSYFSCQNYNVLKQLLIKKSQYISIT